jgi:hypothetical protein
MALSRLILPVALWMGITDGPLLYKLGRWDFKRPGTLLEVTGRLEVLEKR